jgi:hypothetical protein
MAGVSGDNLILGVDLTPEICKFFEAQGLGKLGYDIKENQLTHSPLKQIMVTSDGGPRPQGLALSRIHTIVYVRDVKLDAAGATAKQVVGLLNKQRPPLGGLRIYFEWDQHETFYRDQNRHPIFPLSFTAQGHPM